LKRYGEWETDYEDCDDIYESVRAVLRTPVEVWCDDTKQLLIYATARDNEVELISEELSDEQLLVLAAASINSDEDEAKWQFAEQLGRRPRADKAEKLLLAFALDPDEYVRRRALMALANSGSTHTERFAFTAWESGEEYQRMVCLHALWAINSQMLTAYLQLADQDSRPHLSGLARRIRNKTGEYATDRT
jgi:hypothetical protein